MRSRDARARAAEDARARAMRDARDAYDDDREAVIATYRAETSCDRETASLACALVIIRDEFVTLRAGWRTCAPWGSTMKTERRARR